MFLKTSTESPWTSPPPSYPIIHSATCFFFWNITLVAVSSTCFSLPSIYITHFLNPGLLFHPPKTLLCFHSSNPAFFQLIISRLLKKIIHSSKTVLSTDPENILYEVLSHLGFYLLSFSPWSTFVILQHLGKRINIIVMQNWTYILPLPFNNCNLGDVIQFYTLGSAPINGHGLHYIDSVGFKEKACVKWHSPYSLGHTQHRLGKR